MLIKEILAGSGSLALTTAGWLISQVDPSSVSNHVGGLITQAGGLGLAVWLVYYHTTVAMPTMQKSHAEERIAAQANFQKILDEKRQEYDAEIARQAKHFDDTMNRFACKYRDVK